MFDSVVANKATVDMLTRAVGEGRLPHALIIEGASGSGRHTIAFSIASALAGGDAETECRDRSRARASGLYNIERIQLPHVHYRGCRAYDRLGAECIFKAL